MKYLILLLILTTSCVTQKKCQERFPPISGIDSVYIERLVRDSIIIAGDSLIIEAEVPCDNFELKQENGKLLNELKVVNGILKHRISIKPDTIIKYKTNTVEKIKEVTKPVEVRYTSKFRLITSWIGIIASIVLIVYIGFKIKKFLA